MSKVLDNLKYAPTHEWARVEGEFAYIGITDYAQDSLGAIVYVEGGDVGDSVSQFEEFGAVESVKAASDLLSPLSGTIVEINEEVIDEPELINQDPYTHWLIKIEMSDKSEIDNLLDAVSYQKMAK
ncbi:MAG TPA: glycine cleavage system protein GcvH [Bacilli bacterium]|nr:MAG: Glycine cleavage system H protein [Tenericutes bacterium ADurb.BinA124]HOH17824.1 glycine cleavage system protein GcvH [Bacilli bacterium]HPN61208.1 glycine cleavage system protein GcvH [Bacilli bacterium]HPX84593.1 glycine cleavage system protein GcvH [Bacilli bacterium]HQC74556.1 glycine cleavage system protein GcvH [Bacilli bacterium]